MMSRIKLALFATALAGCLILSAVQAFAQALPVCNWGDMVYRASTGYACLPLDNTPGKFLQGNGSSAQPIWTFQAAAGFLLPTQSTNTFLGNTTGGNASPIPNTVSQILDTIGYDISRPPSPGAMIYKSSTAPNNAWQQVVIGPGGTVLTSVGGVPTWAANTPTLDGFCSTQGSILARNATVWTCLTPGTIGQLLTTNGLGLNTAWATVDTTSLGAVPTSRMVIAGTGLSGGGDLSADRTLSIASTISAAGPIGSATVAPVITFNAMGQLTTVSSATITPAFTSVTGQTTLAQMPTLTPNTVMGNGTAGSAVPTALAMPSCSGGTNALIWTSNTGFGCNTLGTGGTVTTAGAGLALTGGGTTLGLTAARQTLPTITTLTATATYTTPANVLWIEVYYCGGGAGGSGAASGTIAVVGTAGGDSSFNSVTAKGGSPGTASANAGSPPAGGAGGTGGTGTATRRYPGNSGQNGSNNSAIAVSSGGGGGSVLFGGGGAPLQPTVSVGNAAVSDTGGGGGGAYNNSGANNVGGGGGGSSECVFLLINSPSATYAWVRGAGGAGGGSTSNGGAGANGGGYVVEHYGS